MPATYLGAVKFGACIPGLASALNETGLGLEVLRDEVVLHIPCFLEALSGMVGLQLTATLGLSIQLDIALNFNLQLGLTLPSVYIDALIEARIALLASIELLLPDITLSIQLTMVLAVILELQLKIELIVAAFAAITVVLNACYVSLLGIAAAEFPVIGDFQQTKALLAVGGIYAFTFAGALAGLGTALDAQAATTGLSTNRNVVVTVQLVRDADSAAKAAQAAIFGDPLPANIVGNIDVSQTIPGASAAFLTVGTELQSLRDEILEHVSCLIEVLELMAEAEAAATADLRAQLEAALALQAQLEITIHDPSAYIALLIEAIAGITFSLDPTIALSIQLDASASVSASIQAKLDFLIGLFAQITAKLDACYQAMLSASLAATPALGTYHDMKGSLDTTGAFAFSYSGPLSGLGAAINSVTAASGIGPAELVVMTAQMVSSANAAATAAHREIFLVAA